jgi:hypothetical protein
MTMSVHGTPIKVTALEYRLLSYLVHCRDRFDAPVALLDHLYGDDDAREVKAVITRLRHNAAPASPAHSAALTIAPKTCTPKAQRGSLFATGANWGGAHCAAVGAVGLSAVGFVRRPSGTRHSGRNVGAA